MAEEGRKEVTARLCRGVARHLALAYGAGVVSEFPLPSGRRLDLLALLPDGRLWAVEVKSGAADYKADAKWPDYRDWCDGLFFAVDQAFPLALLPGDVGLIVADAFDAHIARDAPAHPLHASRRKAVTLRFALVAARRLAGEGALWEGSS